MPKKATSKPREVNDDADFLNRVDGAAKDAAVHALLEAELDAEINRLKEAFAARMDPIAARVKAEASLLKNYAEKHRRTLFEDGKKSSSTLFCEFGLADNPEKLAQLNRKWKVADSIAALKDAGYGDLITLKESLDKDTIREVHGDDPEFLKSVGLKVDQSERFFIKLRQNSDALKTSSAA